MYSISALDDGLYDLQITCTENNNAVTLTVDFQIELFYITLNAPVMTLANDYIVQDA